MAPTKNGLHAVISGMVDPSPMGESVSGVSTILVVNFQSALQEANVRDHIKREHKNGVLELHFGQGNLCTMKWKEEH